MNAETSFFLTAGFTAVMLAVQVTYLWWTSQKSPDFGFWALAAWLFAFTDFLFVYSALWYSPDARFVSRLMVTVAYGVLFLGAQRAAGRRPQVMMVAGVVIAYGLALVLFGPSHPSSVARVILSRVIWGAFCAASFLYLRSVRNHLSDSLISPAGIFLIQAIYLFLRVASYSVLGLGPGSREPALVTYVDYADAVVFDVALFVAVLIAVLKNRSDELATSRVELTTLSGLLPICAWCRKVRDDEGYWHEVTEYLVRHNEGKITHGICHACAERMHIKIEDGP